MKLKPNQRVILAQTVGYPGEYNIAFDYRYTVPYTDISDFYLINSE